MAKTPKKLKVGSRVKFEIGVRYDKSKKGGREIALRTDPLTQRVVTKMLSPKVEITGSFKNGAILTGSIPRKGVYGWRTWEINLGPTSVLTIKTSYAGLGIRLTSGTVPQEVRGTVESIGPKPGDNRVRLDPVDLSKVEKRQKHRRKQKPEIWPVVEVPTKKSTRYFKTEEEAAEYLRREGCRFLQALNLTDAIVLVKKNGLSEIEIDVKREVKVVTEQYLTITENEVIEE